jgi:hypothetical protein
MALTVAAVDAIRARLAAVGPKDASAREVTRVEAVTRMRGEIVALRERGYSWEEVAALVSSEGCRVAAATLRTELSRKGAAPKGKKREPARGDKKVVSVATPHRVRAQAPPPPPAQPSTPQPRPAPETRIGGFVVREDTEI